MKYLVLGSEGQIGSHLFSYLKSVGESVEGFDIVNNPEEDLRIPNNELLINKIKNADFVYFLAFDVGGSRYLKAYEHSFNFINNNLKILSNTFEVLKKEKTPFIFASSQMANMSHSPYGLTKSLAEQLTKTLDGLIVKFWNVYGIEKDLEKSHVITDLVLKGINTQRVDVLSSGKEKRQFLYTDDCSECLYALSKEYHNIDRQSNLHITSFEWNSIAEVAYIISTKLGNIPISFSGDIDLVQQGIKNEPDPYILKFWTPKVNLVDGIEKIINVYKNENR